MPSHAAFYTSWGHQKTRHFAQTSILLFQKTDQNKPPISFRTACVNLEPEMAKNFFKLWKTLLIVCKTRGKLLITT